MRLAAILVAACVVLPVLAQEGAPPESQVTIDRGSRLIAGLSYGGPLGATARVGLLRGLGAEVEEARDGERVRAVCAVPIAHCAGGFLVEAEGGTGGGKLSLGIGGHARVDSDDFRGAFGIGLKASLVRTWGEPVGTEPGLTYLGPELDLTVKHLGASIGVLWRVAGSGGASAVFSWGLGFRL
jgi:hypothetical protein